MIGPIFGVSFSLLGLLVLLGLGLVLAVAGALWYRRTLRRDPAKIAKLEAEAAVFRAWRDDMRARGRGGLAIWLAGLFR
jgi:hypothetical protein